MRTPASRRVVLLAFVPAVLVSGHASVVGAQAPPAAASVSKDRLTLNDYLDWEDVSTPSMSPDGKTVIYTRTWTDKINDKRESSLWMMNADGIAWSHAGQRFWCQVVAGWIEASRSSRQVSRVDPQVWVRYMDAEGAIRHKSHASAKRRRTLNGHQTGRSIAFGMLARGSDNPGKSTCPRHHVARNGPKPPRVVTKL